ncbi:MAG: sigma-70 family RNA polymerase sigma factor [Clostridiales bacterium]|nr:sigma-70 family RNA polymerase sigma factor [Clostridiales bacterium]
MFPDNKIGSRNLEEAKIVTWFEVGLHREAIRLYKKHQRLLEHEILILNQPISFKGEDGAEILDTLQNTDEMLNKMAISNDPAYRVESSVFVQEMLSILTLQQKRVIRSTVLEGRTEFETAKRLGISQPAVHRTKERALNQLRKQYS